MKVKKDREEMHFGKVPEGSLFWYQQNLYLKPLTSNTYALRGRIAIEFETDSLVKFTSDIIVSPEPRVAEIILIPESQKTE